MKIVSSWENNEFFLKKRKKEERKNLKFGRTKHRRDVMDVPQLQKLKSEVESDQK